MSRIRVVQVIARLNVGGPARILDELAAHLDPAAFEVVVLAGGAPEGEAEYTQLRGRMAIQRIGALGPRLRPASDLLALAELTRALRRLRPHIVHTHTAKAGLLGRVAAGMAGIGRRAHTYHGHLLGGYFRPRSVRMIVRTERLLATRTTRLVGVHASVRDDLLAAGVGVPSQWRVVMPGISPLPEVDPAEARRELDIRPDAEVVGYVGRLARVKRPDRLADAFVQLAQTRPRALLLVAGDGPDGAEFRARLKGLGDRVRHLGWRPDPEVVYAASDVVALSSDNEGLPMSLIEAAWCGRPAVATDVGGVRSVVRDGDTGLVVGSDATALAEGLERLLGDAAARVRMASNARDRAAQDFGADRMARTTADLYREMMA